ncbi:MAG: ArsR family transcriptional regulator [Anaerolineae bacterium]|nr:ArsR family transcriptional regulator [Anaerolineae bacterium]
MQQTRQYILEILRERGEATVDELTAELEKRIHHGITAVTVRHHLDVLRGENLVTEPAIRRRSAPGRPQYVYTLAEKALDTFPNNYQHFARNLLGQLKSSLPQPQINVIIEGMADQMITEARMPDTPVEHRLNYVVDYLSEHGYDANWETTAEGFVLHLSNCPYHQLASDHHELCALDMRLISGLLGIVPRQIGRIADQEDRCSYLIPVKT